MRPNSGPVVPSCVGLAPGPRRVLSGDGASEIHRLREHQSCCDMAEWMSGVPHPTTASLTAGLKLSDTHTWTAVCSLAKFGPIDAGITASASASRIADVPVWATAVIALIAALIGLTGRATFEEWRDFRGARRVVISELKANASALRTAQREGSSETGLPNVIVTSSYRAVQLVLGRYLPDPLWREIEGVYARFTPAVQADPTKAFTSKAEGDRLEEDTESVAGQLQRYRFIRRL